MDALRGTGLDFGGGSAPVFSPNVTVNVQGNGDPRSIGAAVREAMEDMQDVFERWYEDRERALRRESFSF